MNQTKREINLFSSQIIKKLLISKIQLKNKKIFKNNNRDKLVYNQLDKNKGRIKRFRDKRKIKNIKDKGRVNKFKDNRKIRKFRNNKIMNKKKIRKFRRKMKMILLQNCKKIKNLKL